jgi:LysR family transcriptional regulator, benzoate and cis,cis-muconate-responsive activator of ben and cat genes
VELRHLRYFVAVAEELSFRKAARRLSVSEPAVSQQVADLEGELGQKLFNRDSRTTFSPRVLPFSPRLYRFPDV